MANFLENLLPTAGSILGGIGGAALGTVAAPFTGGLVNPVDAGIAGGIAGAGLGGSVGRMGENALTGQKVLQGNDLTAGLEGAAGQGAGEALGAGAGLLGNVLGKGAESGAGALFKGQFAKGLDNESAGVFRDMGLTDANDVGRIADTATGYDQSGEPMGLHAGVMRGIKDYIAPTDLSGIQPTAQDLVNQYAGQLNPESGQQIMAQIDNIFKTNVPSENVVSIAKRLASGGYGNAPKTVTSYIPGTLQNMTGEQAFNISKALDEQAAQARAAGFTGGGMQTNADQAARSKIFQNLAGSVKDSFSNAPLDEDNKMVIIDSLAPLKSSNPQAYNYLVGKVGSAKTVADLRAIEKPLVRGNQALRESVAATDKGGGSTAKNVLGGVLGAGGLAAAGPVGALPGALMVAANHPGAERVGSAVLDRVANILKNPTIQKAVKVTSRRAGNVAGGVPGYDLNNPQGANAMQNTAAVTPGAPAAAASPVALQEMLGLIGLQADPYMANSFVPMINAATQPLQRATAAQGALTGLEGLYSQAGGGVGGPGGLLSRLQAFIPGTAGNQYNQQAEQLRNTLQGLGVPGTVAPSLMAGAPTAQAGFGTIQQIVNALGGNPGSVLAGVR